MGLNAIKWDREIKIQSQRGLRTFQEHEKRYETKCSIYRQESSLLSFKYKYKYEHDMTIYRQECLLPSCLGREWQSFGWQGLDNFSLSYCINIVITLSSWSLYDESSDDHIVITLCWQHFLSSSSPRSSSHLSYFFCLFGFNRLFLQILCGELSVQALNLIEFNLNFKKFFSRYYVASSPCEL